MPTHERLHTKLHGYANDMSQHMKKPQNHHRSLPHCCKQQEKDHYQEEQDEGLSSPTNTSISSAPRAPMPLEDRASGSSSFDNYEFTFERLLDKSEIVGVFRDAGDTESLSDSVMDYKEENGRTYHSYQAGSYLYPNDESETERLDFQYELIQLLFGGCLYFAPLNPHNPPAHILDIATGTGQWAIDMGDRFPTSRIRATDLSPIQPTSIPPNVEFVVEDAMDPWLPDYSYNYIHTRLTLGCWSSFPHQILHQAYHHLSPNGFFEAQELDPSIYCDDGSIREEDFAPSVWVRQQADMAERARRGILWARGTNMREMVEACGFMDVGEKVFRVPINGWDCGKDDGLGDTKDKVERSGGEVGEGGSLTDLERRVGEMWETNMIEGVGGFSMALCTRVGGKSREEVELDLVRVRKGFGDRRAHGYMRMVVVWGRKPE